MKRVRDAARRFREHPGVVMGLGGRLPDGRLRIRVRDLRAHDVLTGTNQRVVSIGPANEHEIDFIVNLKATDKFARDEKRQWHGASLITIEPREGQEA